MRICWAQLQLVTSTAFYVLTENKAKESIKSVIWKSRVWALMLLWSGAWTWQSWLSDKIGFNDNNTILGPHWHWSVSGPGRMIVMVCTLITGRGPRVSVSGWHLHHPQPHLWPGWWCRHGSWHENRVMADHKVLVNIYTICSNLLLTNRSFSHDQIFWLRLTLDSRGLLLWWMAGPCRIWYNHRVLGV